MAAGEETPIEPRDRTSILIDLLGVWPDGSDRVANARLAGLLADRSSRYEGWTGSDVTAATAKHAIPVVQVHRQHTDGSDRRNLRGTARAAVEAALQQAGGGPSKATPAGPNGART